MISLIIQMTLILFTFLVKPILASCVLCPRNTKQVLSAALLAIYDYLQAYCLCVYLKEQVCVIGWNILHLWANLLKPQLWSCNHITIREEWHIREGQKIIWTLSFAGSGHAVLPQTCTLPSNFYFIPSFLLCFCSVLNDLIN